MEGGQHDLSRRERGEGDSNFTGFKGVKITLFCRNKTTLKQILTPYYLLYRSKIGIKDRIKVFGNVVGLTLFIETIRLLH